MCSVEYIIVMYVCLSCIFYCHTMEPTSQPNYLMAATRLDDHVFIFLQNDVGALVKVQDRDPTELGWRTAGLGHVVRSHQVDQGLHYGVVSGVHVSVQREGTFSMAVVSGVAVRSNDPVLPAEVFEAHVQSSLLTALPPVSASKEVPIYVVIREVLLQVRILLLLSVAVRF